MERLDPEVRQVSSLSGSEVQGMFELYARYFDACDRQRFEQDMNSKDSVILLKDLAGIFRGFSTMAVDELIFAGTKLRTLYSGDTVIHHDYWGSQALPLAWCQIAGQLKAEQPDKPLYWFLIVKGHRTYRYLAIFSKRFYPTWRYQTPDETQALINYMASRKFGESYNQDKGVVRFKESQGHLRRDWAAIPDHLRIKSDVKYFLQRNPDYAQGDELVCLAELCQENLRSHALRAFQAAMR